MNNDYIYFGGYKFSFVQNYYRRGTAKKGERFLHRAIWVANNGPIPDGFIIHHKDENTRNNDISNLECMLISDHHKHHFDEMWEQRRKDPALYKSLVERHSEWHRSDEGRKFSSKMNAKNRADGKYEGKDKSAFYAGRDSWVKSDECKEFNRKHIRNLREQGKVSDPSDECRAKAAEWHASPEGLAWHKENGKATWLNRKQYTLICNSCGKEYLAFFQNKSKFCSGNCKAADFRKRHKTT